MKKMSSKTAILFYNISKDTKKILGGIKMAKKCSVPTGWEKKNGKLVYSCCGLDADYKVGNWYVCKGHKEHYTDKRNWKAVSIKTGE